MQLTVVKSSDGKNALISVVPPETGAKKKMNIVIAYDKSGSMDCAANPNGDEITKLFSKNDLTKHSAEIIARTLDENDTLQIITYDNYVATLLPRTTMNDKGLTKAVDAIQSVYPSGCTALWDGLKAAMDAAKKTEQELDGDVTVIMITDGEPSSSPALGEVGALRDHRTKTENSCRIHTVGIGYSIKSKLLADLAADSESGGSFIFIPDGSMMITSWVNLLANEKCTIAKDLYVVVGERSYNLGTVKYGQERNLVVPFEEGMQVTAVYKSTLDGKTKILNIACGGTEAGAAPIPVNDTAVIGEQVRANITRAMTQIQKFATFDIAKSQEIMKKAISDAMDLVGDRELPIMEDIIGQVALGFATAEARDKWGSHHILSLISAHTNQDCLNFKDPGPKMYGGADIRAYRERIDDIVNAMNPPKPSLQSYAAQPVAVSTAQFTQSYNNAYGGCFGPAGRVKMAAGDDGAAHYKLICELEKGDIVDGGARVICVVKYANCDTITIGSTDLSITPWHPIKIMDRWEFPRYLNEAAPLIPNDFVYNFVLDSGHILNVNRLDACTLGHGFDGPVIGHAFYGTQRVIDDLARFPGYAAGLVEISAANERYDHTDMTEVSVCGYVPA